MGLAATIDPHALAKPIDMTMTNGVLRYSVVNRGNGTATPNADGYVSRAASRLVQQRLLLPADAVTMIDQAQNSSVLVDVGKESEE